MSSRTPGTTVMSDPPIARFLFSDVRMSWLWFIVRVYLGYQWLSSGIGKVTNPAWMGDGSALKAYWTRAVAIPEGGRPAITYDWYRDFLNVLLVNETHVWFAKLVVWGEILVGAALILGALVGISAAFGALMNLNFMLAGTVSTNPVLLLLAALLMLAWKTAGYWGVDRVLLPMLGTPWQAGRIFGAKESPQTAH
jgi:thiosulfate dehydrogenase (quinone) large subunit